MELFVFPDVGRVFGISPASSVIRSFLHRAAADWEWHIYMKGTMQPEFH